MGSPKIPSPPPPSAEEQNLLNKQGQLLDLQIKTIKEQTAQNKEIGFVAAISSGLYKPIYDQKGNLTGVTLDPTAVVKMQDEFAQGTEIQQKLLDRYQRAIDGTLPVSEALMQQKAEDFRLTSEIASRRGASITGANLDEAAYTPQHSTGASETVGQLNRTYALRADQERLNVINAGVPQNPGAYQLQTIGAANALSNQTINATTQGIGATSAVLDPYQKARDLEYQRTVNNAALQSQNQAGKIQAGVGAAASAAAIAAAVI